MYAAGTIRTNRFANLPILADQLMTKMRRGTALEIKSEQCNSLDILK